MLGSFLADYKKLPYWSWSAGLLIATSCVGMEMVIYSRSIINTSIDFSVQVQPFLFIVFLLLFQVQKYSSSSRLAADSLSYLLFSY